MLAQLAAALEPRLADLRRRQQVGHLEVRLRRIGHQHERIVRLAEEAGVLAVRQVAAGAAHRLGQDHVRRQIGLAARAGTQRAAGVRRVDAAGEQPAGLHHLVAGVVHGGGRVVAAADERELVGDASRAAGRFRRSRMPGDVGVDRLERPADLGRGVGLHVPGVDLAGRAEVEDHDHRALVVILGHGALGLELPSAAAATARSRRARRPAENRGG